MGRGRSFSPVEDEIIRENYDKTIAELEEILLEHGYTRSRKSINRKLEKMREDGVVGFRSKDTIKRSYRQRTRRSKRLEPTRLDDGWDSGESPFNSADSLRSSKSLWDDEENT